MKPHLPKFLLAAILAGAMSCVSAEDTSGTDVFYGKYYYVIDGESPNSYTSFGVVTSWAGGLGDSDSASVDNDDVNYTGDITLNDSESSKTKTVFGIVNAGTVTGNVTLNLAHGVYASFTSTNAVSVAGGYQGNITGSFNVNISGGTYTSAVIGGHHSVQNSGNSIGSTAITISGGTISGNVYGGGYAGTITGNTAITISGDTGLAALQGSVVSAGGEGGDVNGTGSVTFSNINGGDYDGTVSGGANVMGNSTLYVTGSTISLHDVDGFDKLDVEEGSTLTITGNLATTSNLSVNYDATTVATKTDNGLGAGSVDFRSVKIGDGALVFAEGATVNNGAVSSHEDGTYTVENAFYYVMNTTETDAPADSNTRRTGNVYSLGDGKELLFNTVVHVGKHEYTGPAPAEGANSAPGFYVGENGVLAIMGDSDTMLAGDILETTQGNGDIILRSPGYTDEHSSTLSISVDAATKATGKLYLSPYELNADGSRRAQPGVFLHLKDNADISSFSHVELCYPESAIYIEGHIGADEQGCHMNNLTTNGAAAVYVGVDRDANESLVFGGTTTVNSYEHGSSGIQPSVLHVDFNHAKSKVTINHLLGGDTIYSRTSSSDSATASLWVTTGNIDNYGGHPESINGTVDIDSFDFRGEIKILSNSDKTESIHVNITLLGGESAQKMYDNQLSRFGYGDLSATLKGGGSYILSEGNSITSSKSSSVLGTYNFSKLSTDYEDDGITRVWTGTVEVNNLDATGGGASIQSGINIDDYGNEQSAIHFKGFKGYLVDSAGAVPESVAVKSAMVLENSAEMSAYEIAGSAAGATHVYEGSISGDGQFAISADNTHKVKLAGSIDAWTGNMQVKAGEHYVTFTEDATEINAGISTSGGIMNAFIDNTTAESVSVNAAVSHAEGGVLNMTVAKDTTATFNGAVDVDSFTAEGTATLGDTTSFRAGNVVVSDRSDGEDAVISAGISISEDRVSGGNVSHSLLELEAGASVVISEVVFSDTTITADAGRTVVLDQVTAEAVLYNNVVLSGSGVNYSVTAKEGFSADGNNLTFATNALQGMTLDSGSQATVNLADSSVTGNLLTDGATLGLTITLEGFVMDYVVKAGSEVEDNTSVLSLSTGSLLDDLQFENSILDSLDLSGAEVVYTQNYSDTVNGMHCLVITINDAVYAPIPEPATTTLSLLALAALAGRRRRK